jgi:4-amino-4-deoxy-L-arabinose transferase-like glycosyltransferase
LADSPQSRTITSLQSSLSPRQIVLALLAVNLVWRLLWLPLSKGAYTDGILQVDMVQFGLTYWPPLYGIMTRLFAWAPGVGLENSGRIVSLICGTLTVIPVAIIAQRLFGIRAALMAMVVYTCSPIPLRWSLQVMSDAPFTLLWMLSLAFMVLAADALWPDHFLQPGDEKRPADHRGAMQRLLLASLLGALATLTRYQGIFLFPLIALIFYGSQSSVAGAPSDSKEENERSKTKAGDGDSTAPAPGGRSAFPAWVTLTPWLILPVWLLQKGPGALMIHVSQIGERAQAGSLLQTLLNYWWYFEQFVLSSPYFLTYGIFGFAVYGLFRTQYKTMRIRFGAYASLYLILAILALQSVFQAFQSRYLLPLVPLFCIAAGHGIAIWQKRCMEHQGRFLALVIPALAFGLLFSAAVAFYQGTPFLDIKQASEYVASLPQTHETLQLEREIFTTEVYNADIPTPKVEFWTGRPEIRILGGDLQPKPGDYIILPSIYGGLGRGGWTQYQQVKKEISMLLPAREIAKFASISYPLLPDIMEEPGTHVNPLAWHLRYIRQNFETAVLEVVLPGDIPAAPPAGETSPDAPAFPTP